MATPGVKNPDPSLEAEKGDESATTLNVGAQPDTASKTLEPSRDADPENLLDLMVALTSDNPSVRVKSVKSVAFDLDATSYHDVCAYSRIYGWLPSSRVATASGWKQVNPRCCHFTGKAHMVIHA